MEIKNNKILIIPSWYPTKDNAIVGSFFREQAALLDHNGFNIKILFGILEHPKPKQKLGRKKKIWLALKILLEGKQLTPQKILAGLKQDNNTLLQDPPAIAFTLANVHELAEAERFAVLCNAYAIEFERLLNTGWKPDIIHAQSTLNAGIFAKYLSVQFSIPFVITEHQVFLLNPLTPYHQKLVMEALETAHKVAAVSEHQKKCVLMNQPSCNPSVLWNFVDETQFFIKQTKKPKPFTVVSITYPAHIKDYNTFFKGMKELSLSGEDFRYIMIGNDSFANISHANSDVFIKCSKDLGIFHLGTFIPHLNRDEIADTLSECDVFVCTSIAETFGVAVREAMMCGLPIVTTACGGVEDSITADTGVVVPIRDHKGIADALLKIKNQQLVFDANKIRNFAIDQCGKTAFLQSMQTFYKN